MQDKLVDVEDLADRDDAGRWVTRCHHADASNQLWAVRIAWKFVETRFEPDTFEAQRIDGGIMRARDIRELPHARLITAHRKHLAATLQRFAGLHLSPPGGWDGEPPVDFELGRQRLRDDAVSVATQRRRRRRTIADLERAATAYKRASDVGQEVTAAVMNECRISKSTAGKWIMEARKAGLLKGYEVKR